MRCRPPTSFRPANAHDIACRGDGLLSRRQALATLWGTLLAAGGLGSGCGGQTEPAAEARSAEILNVGPRDLRFGLKVNGRALLVASGDLVTESRALRPSAEKPGDAPYSQDRMTALALWRLVRRNSHHFEPLTAALWAHSPVLYFNSIGFGFCDDVASALAELARTAGLQARVWTLFGHVVPEILVDGRWEMYDPDLGVYYLDAAGQVCGVQQLAADPALITQPYLANPPAWATEIAELNGRVPAGEVRYSDYVAGIYASPDNVISAGYAEVPGPTAVDAPLQLPVGASLSLGLREPSELLSLYGTPLQRNGALRISLPRGTRTTLTMPLLPVHAVGVGRLGIDGVPYDIGSGALAERLRTFDDPVNAIDVLDASTPLHIEYLLNDERFHLGQLDAVLPVGAHPEDLQVSLSALPLPELE